MAPGRRPNHDRRVADLLDQLRAALVAREQERIERTVAAQMSALVGGLKGLGGPDTAPAAKPGVVRSEAPAATGRGNRTGRSAASRKAQSRKMPAIWAARKKGKGAPKAAKPAKATRPAAKPAGSKAKPSAGRLRQIAAMKAFWAKKKAAKAGGPTDTAVKE